MKIRKYKKPDKKQVAELWKNIFSITSPRHDPELSIERKTEYDNRYFFVATDNKKIVGTVMGCYDGHRGWIYSLAVIENYRNRGIGKLLVERVEKELKEFNCPKINLQILNSNKEVVSFYEKIGFNVEDRISMGKKIL